MFLCSHVRVCSLTQKKDLRKYSFEFYSLVKTKFHENHTSVVSHLMWKLSLKVKQKASKINWAWNASGSTKPKMKNEEQKYHTRRNFQWILNENIFPIESILSNVLRMKKEQKQIWNTKWFGEVIKLYKDFCIVILQTHFQLAVSRKNGLNIQLCEYTSNHSKDQNTTKWMTYSSLVMIHSNMLILLIAMCHIHWSTLLFEYYYDFLGVRVSFGICLLIHILCCVFIELSFYRQHRTHNHPITVFNSILRHFIANGIGEESSNKKVTGLQIYIKCIRMWPYVSFFSSFFFSDILHIRATDK